MTNAGIEALPYDALTRIVFGDYQEDDSVYDVVLLLGGGTEVRTPVAAELYLQGRTRYILPTGGMPRPIYGQTMTESEHMTRLLLKLGVPRSAIVQEHEARDTHENMIYSVLQIRRQLRFRNAPRICVVTSNFHMRRSMALARMYLPETVQLSSRWSPDADTMPDTWFTTENGRSRIISEAKLLKKLIDDRDVPDILF
jgi:uncharacterized SAM-binding protein YcdF (DUF218 family)